VWEDYTIDDATGIVTFHSQDTPGPGEVVTIDYAYYADSYHIMSLPYDEDYPPGDNEWSVQGIYMDATSNPEVFEPGIFNPGEEMRIRIRLDPTVKDASTNLVTIGTENRVTASRFFDGG
jgi:hypothetical protein